MRPASVCAFGFQYVYALWNSIKVKGVAGEIINDPQDVSLGGAQAYARLLCTINEDAVGRRVGEDGDIVPLFFTDAVQYETYGILVVGQVVLRGNINGGRSRYLWRRGYNNRGIRIHRDAFNDVRDPSVIGYRQGLAECIRIKTIDRNTVYQDILQPGFR